MYSSYLFFTCYIIVGIWFFLNLLLGVIFVNFSTEEEKISNPYLTDVQIKWINIQKKLLGVGPDKYVHFKNRIRKTIFRIVTSNKLNYLTNFVVFLHALILCLYNENDSKETKNNSLIFSFLFTCFYLFEFSLKIFCFRLKVYFNNKKYRIEFIILVACILYLFEKVFPLLSFIQNEFFTLRIEKILNLLQLFVLVRLYRLMKGINDLIRNLKYYFGNLISLLLILLVIFFVYGLIGCFLFKSVKSGKIIDEYFNFQNFYFAMMTLFKCATCDNWADIMLDLAKTSPNCIENYNCGSCKKKILISNA